MRIKKTTQNVKKDLLLTPSGPGFSLILDLGQSVTQGSMGRDPPRYPPRGPGL